MIFHTENETIIDFLDIVRPPVVAYFAYFEEIKVGL
jgi:hypothetical protein